TMTMGWRERRRVWTAERAACSPRRPPRSDTGLAGVEGAFELPQIGRERRRPLQALAADRMGEFQFLGMQRLAVTLDRHDGAVTLRRVIQRMIRAVADQGQTFVGGLCANLVGAS